MVALKEIWDQLKNNNDGFTYLDVVVAFILFGLVLVMTLRVGQTVHTLSRAIQIEAQMVQMAELEYENYKSGLQNIPKFTSDTGFIQIDVTYGPGGELTSRTLENVSIEETYQVTIYEKVITSNVSEVIVSVTNTLREDLVKSFTGQMLKDTIVN